MRPPVVIAALIATAVGCPLALAGRVNPDDGVAFFDGGTSASVQERNHWAFKPISNPEVPRVKNQRWPGTTIDHFILAKLEAKGLTPNFVAEKRVLIRRATFDLVGLPPNPQDVDDFANDHSPNAFEKVIDRLLASPRYGERWGRYWLDLARYADTAGDSADYPIPQAYKYRNYVIDSFNADKPYDQFVREQIAGDLLPAASEQERRDKMVATGYLALARRFGVDPPSAHHLTLEDAIDTMGRSLLGLSLSCARCHDHKYDPIPTEDYYGLYGILQSTRFPFAGSENKKKPADLVPLIPQAQVDALIKPFDEQMAKVDAEIEKLEEEGDVLQREGLNSTEVRQRLREAKQKRRALLARAPNVDLAFAVAEGKPANARVQRRGDPSTLGAEVPRHFLKVLGGQSVTEMEGSGRLDLAQWLTTPTNPLAARVIVNRVWQHHFGKGIVQTPSDFGARGRTPTHPELLDHLAARFIQGGWSIKSLHKWIMLSQAWQQSSIDNPEGQALDPANELLWKFNRQRLEAEIIRDSLLQVSRDLDLNWRTSHPFPSEYQWQFTQHNQFTASYDSHQRSIYLMQQRIKRRSFFATFDAADPNSSTAERTVSTTPLQALFMMNDPFVHGRAAHFVSRLQGSSDTTKISSAYRILFSREPARVELQEAINYLHEIRQNLASHPAKEQEAEAWTSFARALLASNEFLYVD